jgi:nitrogen fixation protein FixH
MVTLLATSVLAGDLTKIRVVVTTASGKPVDRAGVRVAFQSGRSIAKFGKAIKTSWEMRTSQEGIANIPELPKGKILIQVNAKNYQTYGETFDIDEDERTIEVKLNPPQQQYSAH